MCFALFFFYFFSAYSSLPHLSFPISLPLPKALLALGTILQCHFFPNGVHLDALCPPSPHVVSALLPVVFREGSVLGFVLFL